MAAFALASGKGEADVICVWESLPVEAQQRVRLVRWIVLRTGLSSLHVVRFRADHGTCRVSTALVEFNRSHLFARTASGRVYHLLGQSGDLEDAECVWRAWAVTNNVGAWEDVTDEVIAGGLESPVRKGIAVH